MVPKQHYEGPQLNHANIIVHDLAKFTGVKTATRLFGHILGAYPDGQAKTASEHCCSSEGYIMSNNRYDKANIEKVFKDKRNANKWSTCSLEAITKFSSEVSCHFNTPSTDPYPLFSWQELTHNAQVPHLSDQCSMYLPRKEGITDENVYGSCGTDPCQYLECIRLHKYTNDDTGCAVHERQSAMEGSECGHNWVSDSYQ